MRNVAIALSLLLVGTGAFAAIVPPEMSAHIATQNSFIQGTERLYPVELRKDAAQAALVSGGMWLTAPDGERTFARTVRVDQQRDGNQTWIGKVSTPGGQRSVVITFGRDATFGSLVSATGKYTRLTTEHGMTYLAQTDARAAAAHAQALKLLPPPAPDYLIPPRTRTGADVTGPASFHPARMGNQSALASRPGTFVKFSKDAGLGSWLSAARKSARLTSPSVMTQLIHADVRAGVGPVATVVPTTQVTSGTPMPTVDVLLGYTSSLIPRFGSTSAVVTRLTYLIALTNQAYADSQVNGRIRLVGTLEVDYSDVPTGLQALNDLTSSSLSGPVALRNQRRVLGADLVSLIRPYLPTSSDRTCGYGWENGLGLQPYTTASARYGYSVVDDGIADDGSSCGDTALAHEMGHNMGLAHDKANATEPGAFTYAYGWRQTLTTGSFATIMAYATGDQQWLPYFADPNITLCNGNPCGDAIEANQTLALNQTMPVAAAFNAPGGPLLDLDGDGVPDLVLQQDAGGQVAYMLEQPYFFPSSSGMLPVSASYHIAAVGDLYGDRRSELIWASAADLYFWTYNGAGGFTATPGPKYAAGWKLVGTGDINGDGTSDLLWINPSTHQFSYNLMSGTAIIGGSTMNVAPGYYIAAIGDFTGNGRVDLVWTSAANDLYFWMNNGDGSFTGVRGLDYPAGWQLAGSGDIDGDGRADLLWTNDSIHQFVYWLMNGSSVVDYWGSPVAAGYHIVSIDRFAGGAVASVLWTSAANDLYLWQNNGNGKFTVSSVPGGFASGSGGGYYTTYPRGWSVFSPLPQRP